ncbi:extracellular solute-binding protein [Paenibacillus wulumuqiensis]|uniref:extracellular solute-binding protein n=1 Tax=Paenibacillus wulumuqiensis TaxID=1567107 RepID=UPI001F21ECB2|nr:extracellular solute-binding protein [Paenibacillus wulumuqiensis]
MMRKRGKTRSAAALLLSFVITLTACSSGAENTTGSASQAGTADQNGIVTLRVLVNETGTNWNTYPDSDIAKEIEKKVGVKIEYVEADANKMNVLLAGGDLPDIVRADPTQYGKQLIDGKLIIPMDDLLDKYGKDIQQTIPTVVDYSRSNWSEGQNKLYFLPPQIQADPSPIYPNLTIGPTMRWDYYKEIGTPPINSTDDLLNVLQQISAKHPATEEGKKIYGVSMWQDWGLWPYIIPFTWITQQSAIGSSDLFAKPMGEHRLINVLTDENSNYWVAMDFYNQAYRMGLLDPDALTMKNNDYMAKATAGQFILGPATWAMGDFNAKYAKDGKGYMVLPVGKQAWSGGVRPVGWADKSYAISKSSKYPEKAMEFLNYIHSYEGARTLYSGIEGNHWNMENGKPQLTKETIEMKVNGGDAWERTGIALDQNLIGLGGSVIDPKTKTPVNLFSTEESMAASSTTLEKDFSKHYGASYPGEVVSKLVQEGKLQDENTPLQNMTAEEIIQENTVVLPVLNDDLLKLETQLKELAARTAATMILSKSDEDFTANKQEAIAAFKAAGADQLTQFLTTEYSKALQTAGVKQ